MTDDTIRTRVIHGLRHRPSGGMVRVREDLTVLQEEPYRNEETTWHMTLAPECPLFDAGSPAILALALAPTSGSSPARPAHDGFDPSDLEPVVVTETLSRSVRPADVVMDLALRIPRVAAVDVRPGMAADYEGLDGILEAVEAHRAELEAIPYPGEDFAWGPCRLTGLLVAAQASDLPDEVAGRLVATEGRSSGTWRALAILDVPERDLWRAPGDGRGAPLSASMVVCLSDARVLPEGLMDHLSRPAGPTPA